jgi:Lon protease-like protein
MRSDQNKASTVAALPIFPLTGMLLLPGTFMPLNVFEQRYRNMVQDVVRGDHLIGMIQPLEPAADNFGPVGARSGVPDIYSVGCAGRIAEWERESDGRYLIVLEGERRFRVRDELTLHRGYRRVRAQLLSDHYSEPGTESRVTAVLLGSALEYCRAHRIGFDADLLEALPGSRLTNALAAALPFRPEEKQALLEASGIEDRASILLQLFEMSGVVSADSQGPVPFAPN